MSGIYISNLEMPKNCWSCPFVDGDDGFCHVDGLSRDPNEKTDCPLVPVPPHGRLIDADALTDAIDSTDWYHQAPNKEMVHGANSAEHQAWYKEQDVYATVENAPTIIPADKEGEA